MKVVDKHTAKVEFQEDWALDGAPVYCLLKGRMMAEEPKQYTVTATYKIRYRYGYWQWKTEYYTCYDAKGNATIWPYCYRVPVHAENTTSGTMSGKLLVNGTGVDHRAQ